MILALLSAACRAGFSIGNAALGARTSGEGAFVLAVAWAALLTVPLGVAHAGSALGRPDVLAGGFLVAHLSIVIAGILTVKSLRRMTPRVFGVLMSLEPAVAGLAGMVFLGEELHSHQWLAIGCVMAACAGVTTTVSRDGSTSSYRHSWPR